MPRACLLVVHTWARKGASGGSGSGRRGSRPLQFTGARKSCRKTLPAGGAAGSRAQRAATAKGAMTGTGPNMFLLVSRPPVEEFGGPRDQEFELDWVEKFLGGRDSNLEPCVLSWGGGGGGCLGATRLEQIEGEVQ